MANRATITADAALQTARQDLADLILLLKIVHRRGEQQQELQDGHYTNLRRIIQDLQSAEHRLAFIQAVQL